MDLLFSLQTIRTTGAGTLKSLEPDKDGIYRGVPLAVLGMVSRNNMYYEPQSVVDAMKNPDSRFFKAITGGGLDGEWGHPDLTGLDDRAALMRLALIKESMVSHSFSRVWTERTQDGKYVIVKGDVKAFGPYGRYLTQSFSDKDHDTGFSLRTLTSQPVKRPSDGAGVKRVLAMITFDGVSVPGYELASKRSVAAGLEGVDLLMETEDVRVIPTVALESMDNMYDTIGYENINCQQVLDILKSDDITVSFESEAIGVFDSTTGTFNTNVRKTSVFHQMAKKGAL